MLTRKIVIGGEEIRTPLGPGEYAINPPGVWHTANIAGEAVGLFIARGIAEAHGGSIWADSQVGVGSTFTFTLPAIAPPQAEAARP